MFSSNLSLAAFLFPLSKSLLDYLSLINVTVSWLKSGENTLGLNSPPFTKTQVYYKSVSQMATCSTRQKGRFVFLNRDTLAASGAHAFRSAGSH